MKPEDRQALLVFQQKVANLFRAVNGANRTADDLKTRMKQIKRSLNEVPWADRGLTQQADKIDSQLDLILRRLRGDRALQARNENVPTAILERVSGIMGDTRMSIQRPTGTHMESYRIAGEEFAEVLNQLRALYTQDITKLENEMESAGAPWTPGRIPTWQEQ